MAGRILKRFVAVLFFFAGACVWIVGYNIDQPWAQATGFRYGVSIVAFIIVGCGIELWRSVGRTRGEERASFNEPPELKNLAPTESSESIESTEDAPG
jgi:hypothetical protein